LSIYSRLQKLSCFAGNDFAFKRVAVIVFTANLALSPVLAANLQIDAQKNSPARLIAMDTDKTSGGSHRLPRPGASIDSSDPAASASAASSSAATFPSSSSFPSAAPDGASSAGGSGAASSISSLGTPGSGVGGSASQQEAEEAAASPSSLDDLRNKLEGIQREAASTKSAAMPKPAPDISSADNAANSHSTTAAPASKRVLQGSIDQYGEAKQQAFNIGLGIIAKHDDDSKSSTQILRVLPASLAEQAGVHAGDHLLKETLDKDVVQLSLQRNGRMLQIAIKTGGSAMFDLNTSTAGPLMASVGKSAFQAGASGNALKGGATAVKLKSNVVEQMRDHDVVMILDMSGSMQTRDCQGLSRWDWVGSQSNELAMAAQQAASDLTVMLFSSGYQVMEHASPALIPMIFQRVRPNGGTMLAPPLDDALTRYFNARQSNPNTKPLIIAIITDGLPSDYGMVRQRIVDAANATRRDGEISITFMLINGRLSGNRQMEMLDSQLNTQRDIVNLVEFDQVLQLGVKQALFEALSGRQLRNVPLSNPMMDPMMGLGPLMGGHNSPFRGLRGMPGIQNFLPGGNSLFSPAQYSGGNGQNYNSNSNYSQNGVQNYR
jgi:uncharacterized protein YegL